MVHNARPCAPPLKQACVLRVKLCEKSIKQHLHHHILRHQDFESLNLVAISFRKPIGLRTEGVYQPVREMCNRFVNFGLASWEYHTQVRYVSEIIT